MIKSDWTIIIVMPSLAETRFLYSLVPRMGKPTHIILLFEVVVFQLATRCRFLAETLDKILVVVSG
ncbi:hypothetical protein [Nostoc sp.]|uniref:hypothetical protein n=1 Tax=Nostoc sp. TaxID=1180 RepID=UPI002FF8F873